MNRLKALGGAVALTFALFASALACDAPIPGQVQTPPCVSSQMPTPPDESLTQDEQNSQPLVNSETIFAGTALAMTLLESALSLY